MGIRQSGTRRNLLTDVPGVRVGHCSLHTETLHTGVTAILPCEDNLFAAKLPCAAHVFNGFGKTLGLVQVEELGTLETPIVLTNTLSVGMAHHAVVQHMLEDNPGIGGADGTVNPVVLECNDSGVNDIRALAVTPQHVTEAIAAADGSFEEGAVGAGSGMVCYSLKGGIGSASRLVTAGENEYMLGALVLTNFGTLPYFTPYGKKAGEVLAKAIAAQSEAPQPDNKGEMGSIIVVLATDAPLDARQLGRVAKRAGVGIARTGSFVAHGSGEIALAFSTANRVPHGEKGLRSVELLGDDALDAFFAATAEVVEESILSSMLHAQTVTGYNGKTVLGLQDALALTGVPNNLCAWAKQ